jgi:hypothetical protein
MGNNILRLLGAARNQWKRSGKNSETCISAREYHDILQRFEFKFYLQIFSEELPHAKKKKNFRNDACKSNEISY